MDKYKELYDFAREAVAQSEARFDQIDAKASNYLSIFTVLLGGASFFVKAVADRLLPPHRLLEVALTAVAALTTLLLASTWISLFQVLRVFRIKAFPLNRETVHFFRRNRLVDIYSAVADRLTEAWVGNQAVNEKKLARLTSAYRTMMITVALLLGFVVLYGIHVGSGRGGAP